MGVAARIGELAQEYGISIKELSRRADIPYTTLYHAVKRDSKMDFDTISKVAEALKMRWYELFRTDNTTSASSYDQRLAAACKWLDDEQMAAEINDPEYDNGKVWSVEERNDWIQAHLEEASTIYNVKKGDLIIPRYVESIDFDFYAKDTQLNECIARIVPELEKMNEGGRQVAIERIQELAQIPKYQRHPAPAAPQELSAAAPDKDPEQE